MMQYTAKALQPIRLILLLAVLAGGLVALTPRTAQAQCISCGGCCGEQNKCGQNCDCTDYLQMYVTLEYITDEFLIHREWLVKIVWEAHMLPAMMLMTEQLTATAMWQVLAIGMFLDAKHQLETQNLFQELQAEIHKDYHVSEGVCKFGTNVRSLAASIRNAELSHVVLSERMIQRNLLSGDLLTSGPGADQASRLEQFMNVYCNPKDNAKGFTKLCGQGGTDKARLNKDVDFTTTMDRAHTLKLDFTPEGDSEHTDRGASPDEEDLFALQSNLYGHLPPFPIPETYMAKEDGTEKPQGAYAYMDLRSLIAQRSVAQNSFAAIAALKTKGAAEVKPYMETLLKEIGLPQEEIDSMLADKPSYYAQMDVLTKKIYQDPVFYMDLYDKPANVMRKNVAMRAINNIQKRDIYRSIIRSESIMSVWLETELKRLQDANTNEIDKLEQDGNLVPMPQ